MKSSHFGRYGVPIPIHIPTHIPTITYYYLLLPPITYYYLLLPTITYYYLLLPTITYYYTYYYLLLPTITYYYLLLPTITYYYLILPTITYYYLLLPTITYSPVPIILYLRLYLYLCHVYYSQANICHTVRVELCRGISMYMYTVQCTVAIGIAVALCYRS